MRSALLASLVIIGLVAIGLHNHTELWTVAHHKKPRPVKLGETAVPAKALVSWTAEGVGPDEDTARQVAVRVAQLRVQEYLSALKPPVAWTPALEEYTEKHLLRPGGRQPGEAGITLKSGEHWKSYRVELTPEDQQQMARLSREDQAKALQQEREQRIQARMLGLGKGLLGLVVLLSALSGYIHLDERSKGYYKMTLRLGVVGLIAALGVGLWWLS